MTENNQQQPVEQTPAERGAARGLPSADDVRGILPATDQPSREGERWTIYVCPVKSCRSIRRDEDDSCGYGPHSGLPVPVEVVPLSTLRAAEAERDHLASILDAEPSDRAAIYLTRAEAAEAQRDALLEGLKRLLDSMLYDSVEYEQWTVDAEPVDEARALLSTQEPTR